MDMSIAYMFLCTHLFCIVPLRFQKNDLPITIRQRSFEDNIVPMLLSHLEFDDFKQPLLKGTEVNMSGCLLLLKFRDQPIVHQDDGTFKLTHHLTSDVEGGVETVHMDVDCTQVAVLEKLAQYSVPPGSLVHVVLTNLNRSATVAPAVKAPKKQKVIPCINGTVQYLSVLSAPTAEQLATLVTELQ